MTLFLELDRSLEPDTYVMEDIQGGWRLRAPALAELFNGAGRFLHEGFSRLFVPKTAGGAGNA